MLIELLIAAVLAAPAAVDTTIAVAPDGRLEVDNPRGEVTVRTWDRSAVRIVADLEDRDDLWIEGTRSVLSVRTRSSRGQRSVEFTLTIPRGMAIRVEGNDLDVDMEGLGGAVEVESVHGDIRVVGGVGNVRLHAVHGEVQLTSARGRIDISSVNEEVWLRDVEGAVRVETTNGDIEMLQVRSDDVFASTTNGDLTYDGTVVDGGRYTLTTHNGDISATVAESANATIRVATYQGDFEADYPVRLVGSIESKEFTFTLGSGSARIDLESFSGSIRLRRPRR